MELSKIRSQILSRFGQDELYSRRSFQEKETFQVFACISRQNLWVWKRLIEGTSIGKKCLLRAATRELLTTIYCMQYITYMNTSFSGKIERTPLRERVYVLLQQAIVTGELPPGQRVRDVDLAAQFGVSRTPVREALQRLEDEGLVETLPGALTRIVPLNTLAAREAFPVVAVLHALATRLARVHLVAQDIITLQQANMRFTAAIEARDVPAAIQADDAFHACFVSAARNGEIQRALERLMPKVRRLEIAQFSSLAGRTSILQHQAIIVACEQQHPLQAAELVEQNWLSLGQLIVQSLEQQQGPLAPKENEAES